MTLSSLAIVDVAVIGAGLAGLSCARALADAGRGVAIFDKARGVGGRMATRRGTLASFDHGAQYFTARDPDFVSAVGDWQAAGVVGGWQGRIRAFDGLNFAPVASERRFVGLPGMSSLGRHLLGSLPFFAEHKLMELAFNGSDWRLKFDDGGRCHARWLVLAVPAPQAAALLGPDHPLHEQVAAVSMAPCWSLMLRFDHPLPCEFEGCFVNTGPLSWVARNSSKPGRPSGEAWVLHACPEWSRLHVRESPESVVVALLSAFSRIANVRIEPPEVNAHRWLYALADRPLYEGCLLLEHEQLGLAGDWLHGSRIEGAWLSGRQLAQRLLAL
ncbi:NAD(P)/FAD-dependent oxidoreductase [Chitinimonas naiadis]